MSAIVNFIGHSTVHLHMDGVRLLTDPLLKPLVGHLRRQVPEPDPSLLDVDAVLISHLHGDHLDLPSLEQIGRDTPLIVPRGASSFLKLRRFRNVQEIEAGDSVRIGDVRVIATHALHEGRRLPWSQFVQPLGYIIDGSSEIYFAGDTDIFPEMIDIGEDLDLALVPVWGWGPTLGKGHMDPQRAAESLAHIQARIAIPIHWGTYCPIVVEWFRPKFLSDPPLEFATHAAEISPDVIVQIVQPGLSFELA